MGLLSIIPEIPAIPEGLGNLENLGNLVSGFSVEEIIGKAGAYFNGLIAKLIAMIPPSVMALYNTHKVVFLLAAICLLVLVAYEGHRFFKMVTYAGSAFLFGLIGFWYLSPALEATLRPMIPPILDYHVTVAVACAVIAVLLCKFAFNLVILLIGGGAGYILGSGMIYGFIINYFNTLTFLQTDMVKKVIGGIVAVIFAMVFVLLFKLLFTLATSFGGMVGAALLLQMILIPTGDTNMRNAFIAAGVVLGIACLIRQHNEERNTIFRI